MNMPDFKLKSCCLKSFTSVATLHPKTHIHTFNRVLLTANVDIFPGVAGSIGWFGAVPRLKSKDLTLISALATSLPLKLKSASNSPCLLPFIIPWKEKKKKAPLSWFWNSLGHISAPASFSTCPRSFSFSKSCQFSLLLNTVTASHPCFLDLQDWPVFQTRVEGMGCGLSSGHRGQVAKQNAGRAAFILHPLFHFLPSNPPG